MSDTLDQFQQSFAITIDLPVQWGEMDAFGHVNNVVYFRYFESVRIAYLSHTSLFGRSSDSDQSPPGAAQQRQGREASTVFPILAATECRYKYPLSFPDSLKLGCRVTEFHEHGFLQSYGIYSSAQDRITTVGTGRIVLINVETGQKVPLSAKLKTEMEALGSL